MDSVCRTCMRIIDIKETAVSINNSDLREKLEICLPELILDSVVDPKMCSTCSAALSLSFRFKGMCYEAEKTINSCMLNKMSTGSTKPLNDIELLTIGRRDIGEMIIGHASNFVVGEEVEIESSPSPLQNLEPLQLLSNVDCQASKATPNSDDANTKPPKDELISNWEDKINISCIERPSEKGITQHIESSIQYVVAYTVKAETIKRNLNESENSASPAKIRYVNISDGCSLKMPRTVISRCSKMTPKPKHETPKIRTPRKMPKSASPKVKMEMDERGKTSGNKTPQNKKIQPLWPKIINVKQNNRTSTNDKEELFNNTPKRIKTNTPLRSRTPKNVQSLQVAKLNNQRCVTPKPISKDKHSDDEIENVEPTKTPKKSKTLESSLKPSPKISNTPITTQKVTATQTTPEELNCNIALSTLQKVSPKRTKPEELHSKRLTTTQKVSTKQTKSGELHFKRPISTPKRAKPKELPPKRPITTPEQAKPKKLHSKTTPSKSFTVPHTRKTIRPLPKMLNSDPEVAKVIEKLVQTPEYQKLLQLQGLLQSPIVVTHPEKTEQKPIKRKLSPSSKLPSKKAKLTPKSQRMAKALEEINLDLAEINDGVKKLAATTKEINVGQTEKHAGRAADTEIQKRKEGEIRSPVCVRQKCPTCGKFYSVTYLKEHMRSHPLRFKCDLCSKTFSVARYLRLHTTKHFSAGDNQCDVCEKYFSSKYVLKKHHQFTHSVEKPHVCAICNCLFEHKVYLDIHMHTHTGERNFICYTCRATFSKKVYLVEHVHTHTRKKPYQCDLCPKVFMKSAVLLYHKHLHGLEQFKCDTCHRLFTDKTDLECHITKYGKSHNRKGKLPDRVFSCSICTRYFITKFSRNRHMERHAKESSDVPVFLLS